MSRKFAVTGVVIAVTIIANGCASYGGYQPTVDPYNDPNIGRLEQDKAECNNLAHQAGSVGTNTAQGAGVGALVGAAGGAALGAIYGNPATGAATGAVIGGIGGGASQGIGADNDYKRAFNNCMRNRGHNVIN